MNERAVNRRIASACGKEHVKPRSPSIKPNEPARNVVQKWLLDPIIQVLRAGATPKRLAWSLAIGFIIGINPLLGSTTLLTLAVASMFRLNIVGSQITNHFAYPFQLVLFPVFIKFGSMLFHTESLPLNRDQMFRAVKQHPWETTRLLWTWEWHALIVWLLFAAVATPLLARALRPLLARMLYKLGDEHRIGNEHVHVLPE